MKTWRHAATLSLIATSWYTLCPAEQAAPTLREDFSAGDVRWAPYFSPGEWGVRDDVFRSTGKDENSARLAKLPPVADVMIDTEVRVGPGNRGNVGLVLRAQEDQTCLVLRYYDRIDSLELLEYVKGKPTQKPGGAGALKLTAGTWYRMKAAVIDDLILGKLWRAAGQEPGWQFRAQVSQRQSGGVGLVAQDATQVEFQNVSIWTGAAVAVLKDELKQEKADREKKIRETLELKIEPTPFVLKSKDGPLRRINVRTTALGKPEPVGGKLSFSCGGISQTLSVEPAQFEGGAYPLLVSEPTQATELHVTFDSAIGKTLEATGEVTPVRRWTIYMTPHTHYDIGYTHSQPEVIERLSKDMDLAVKYCTETADWPAESRYRWTVEVTGLMKNYIERHSEAEVARFMDLVKQGRIEICGYYLNMPTEVVGHEEEIRCLYYAQELRKRYGVTIDTAMINDVPGYGWALPQLLREAGISRVSFRANSIRGQFLWYRPGAVQRPFYWEGPEGSRVFFWYTDSYRSGNFFRAPGLHEGEFLNVIRRNEGVGYPFDDIQLRMGGDNLPPEFNTSRNARAWNDKYLWPRVVVATNREFLEPLETRHGAQCKTYRGDIPSWWAEGPASSAHENGIVRLLHDQLVATETLWTLARLVDPKVEYPRREIDAAYDKMIHFDEHTWGASCSISEPQSEKTLTQWKWKAAYAHDAKRLGDHLYRRALEEVSRGVSSKAANSFVVWNTLAWPRTDVVELSLGGTPFEGQGGVAVKDARDGKILPLQRSADGKQAWFIATNIPPVGYAVFNVESGPASSATPSFGPEGTLENAFYRIVADPQVGGLKSWYDKDLNRELLDPNAAYLGNQPIYERSLDGRDAIDRKTPSRFSRVVPKGGKLISQTAGPVFREMVIETSLPTVPTIRQCMRLYNDLKMVDIINGVTKEEIFEPEGLYVAFPFEAGTPEIRFQIANASMRPGKDQLTYSCQDFYAIQHWVDVAAEGYGIVLAPVEAPLVLAGGLNAYQWADRIDFNNGHLYSWPMNNYWCTNFRAGQSGTMLFRYRLTSYAGPPDAVRTTQFAWQPFYPLVPVWLKPDEKGGGSATDSLVQVGGDPLIVSCIKQAESGDGVIVRLLEVRGKPARCALRFTLPKGRRLIRAYKASCLEVPGDALEIADSTVKVTARPNEIVTIGLVTE